MITLLPILSSNQPEVKWTSRSARIENDVGKVVFEQHGIEAPEFWSDMAVRIVASKYFYGAHGTPQRESSIKKMVHRVVNTIVNWGRESRYYDDDNAEIFYNELTYILVHQLAAFNSPVWFNVGLWHEYKAGNGGTAGGWAYDFDTGQSVRQSHPYLRPQGSACFIQGVDDTMESIMALATSEAALFKFGSGTGTDLTPIRSSQEHLSGGGRPSGPMSFLRIYDQVAGSIKSGGKTRRAAKMNTLRDWHPDIEEFITAKKKEEMKAHALIDAGYDGSFNGEAYASVAFQNENLSVRVSDEFMEAAIAGRPWSLKAVTTGEVVGTKDASKLLDLIAEGTWFCGDPGVQYDGPIQAWHTCAGTEPIHSTNPCAEYIFLNNTACNLASLNLLKFKQDNGDFDIVRFQAAVRVLILAQDILVDWASYPTKLIADNSHIFRTLGLGYANLGALIMSYGLPYDSDEARGIASSVASLMTGEAYLMSAKMAESKGPFKGYDDARCAHVSSPTSPDNKASMHKVIKKHAAACDVLSHYDKGLPANFKHVITAALVTWQATQRVGEAHGFRNAQVSVLAPTGTIAFMMDCDTTGVEPDIALVKYKLLAGSAVSSGYLKIVNNQVPAALRSLGYSQDEIIKIVSHIAKYDTIENVDGVASGLADKHLPVFDCALKPSRGSRSISWQAHINMMAAIQPFISGAISKTINMPSESTVEDIREAYILAWQRRLKCVAIYRNDSKRSQPLNTSKSSNSTSNQVSSALEKKVALLERQLAEMANSKITSGPMRRRLPDTRAAKTHKFDISGHEGYVTVGMYDDGRPGELFIQMAKEGSTVGGLMDTIGTLTSISLQYGVPLDILVSKFSNQRFEPHGYTSNSNIRTASSISDYIFRWMSQEFTGGSPTVVTVQTVDEFANAGEVKVGVRSSMYRDGKCCHSCGSVNIQVTGTCAACLDCGSSLGCS